MPTIDYKKFAADVGANVVSQAAYTALLAGPLVNGFQDGIADTPQLNKVWRQSAMVAAAVATYVSNALAVDVLDDGDLPALVTKLTNAIIATIQANTVNSVLFPFTATQAANALTLTLGAGSVTYRNATLSNGTPVTAANGALNLVIPATSNLGMVASGQSNRLIGLVAYNAGVPVACVVNLAGGVNLDETTLISPTLIGIASNSSNTIYSAAAVAANSPFRVIGFVDAIFTTGVGWSTPTEVQPAGGLSMVGSIAGLGVGQAYQNVTGSRTLGVTYYNLTGKPIFVCIDGGNGINAYLQGFVNGAQVIWSRLNTSTGSQLASISFIVPPGASYSATMSFGTVNDWTELR